MTHRLRLGGLAALLLAGTAGSALAEGALDAPMLLADRTLVRLERLDITVDPASGAPGDATRRYLGRLLADASRRSCVVAAQVLGRLGRAELEGADPLGAHRRARARAEQAAGALSAAGIERDRIVAGWDPSRPGDPGRMTIWLMTDWSEGGCAILPSDTIGVALAPPPVGVGMPAAPGPSVADGAATGADRVAPTDPARVDRDLAASPVPVQPAASVQTAATPPGGADAPPATDAATASASVRPDALDLLRRLVAGLAGLVEPPAETAAAAPVAAPTQAIALIDVPSDRAAAHVGVPEPGLQPTATAAERRAAAGPPRALAAAAPPPVGLPAPLPAGPEARPPHATVAVTAPPRPPAARASLAGQPAVPTPVGDVTTVAATGDLPEVRGQFRAATGLAQASAVELPSTRPGRSAAPPEPAAGGPGDEAAFRFPENSSILDAAQKRQLEALARTLPADRTVTLQLTVAVGAGDVAGTDEAGARRYNRWLAERRAARVERWLRHYAGDRPLSIRTELHEGDPSRTVRLSLARQG